MIIRRQNPNPNPSGRRTTSFVTGVRRVTTAPAGQGNLTQQTFSSYRLQWEKLRSFLEDRFPKEKYPNLEFTERKINGDRYVFMAPEALTSDDHVEITKLCDENPHAQQEREQSEEP